MYLDLTNIFPKLLIKLNLNQSFFFVKMDLYLNKFNVIQFCYSPTSFSAALGVADTKHACEIQLRSLAQWLVPFANVEILLNQTRTPCDVVGHVHFVYAPRVLSK